MTAINTNTATTVTAIDLEQAPLGAIAHLSDESPVIIKMSDSGMPWMYDPFGEHPGAERMTTAHAARLGYVPAIEQAPDFSGGDAETTPEDVRAHIVALAAQGVTYSQVAKAAGATKDIIKNFVIGRRGLSAERQASALSIPLPYAEGYVQPTESERLEDLLFLLRLGVDQESAVARCGWEAYKSAQRSARMAGEDEIVRLLADVSEDEDDLAA